MRVDSDRIPVSLFRADALEAQRPTTLGTVLIITPAPVWIISLLGAGVVLAIAAYLYLAHYTRRFTAEGLVVLPLKTEVLTARTSGEMLRVDVTPGEYVTKGRILLEYATRQIDERHAAAKADGRMRRGNSTKGTTLPEDVRVRTTLAATADGLIWAILTSQGEFFSPGAPLLDVKVPNGGLRAEFLVPGSIIPFVRRGQRVVLHYDVLSAQRVTPQFGVVEWISLIPVPRAQVTALMGKPATELQYQVIVRPDREKLSLEGRVLPLRPGMVVHADIVLERGRLLEWVLGLPHAKVRGTGGDTPRGAEGSLS